MNNWHPQFARRIYLARVEQNMSQEQLAEKCGTVQSVVSMWETGARRPGTDHLRNLAQALNKTADHLLGLQ
jgi:transcriptional regulator with XRE-family HTH domain